MANSNGWGDGAANNTIGWGQGANNTIGWGSVYSSSNAGRTDIIGTTGTAPVNTIAPVVSGNTYVGDVLTTTNGTWTGSPTFTYQWYTVNTGNPIVGATSTTYTLVAADAAKDINCQVTGTNAAGSSIGSSNVITTTALAAPTNLDPPVIDDGQTYYEGSTLIFTGNVWDSNPPNPTLTYQWLRDGANIGGATNVTYTAVAADVYSNISVKCIATNSQGTDFVISNYVTIQP